MRLPKAKYRWATPREWLEHALGEGALQSGEVIICLLDMVDSDQLQDVYQDEMERDGYFEERFPGPTCEPDSRPVDGWLE